MKNNGTYENIKLWKVCVGEKKKKRITKVTNENNLGYSVKDLSLSRTIK